MTKTVDLHPEARAEYLDALAWYIAHSERVGRRFQAELNSTMDWLADFSEQCPHFDKDTLFKRLKRFPYVLFFELLPDNKIQVLAIAHERRRPGYWRHRRT